MSEPDTGRQDGHGQHDDRAAEDPAVAGLERLEAVIRALEDEDAAAIDRLLAPLHAADIADILEQMAPAHRGALLRIWHRGIDGEMLSEVDESIREEVIRELPEATVVRAIRALDTDDIVDILEDLDTTEQQRLLGTLDKHDRVAVEQGLAYPENTAGRLMQREVAVAPEHWTVGDAIDFLRRADRLPDQFYHVILTDPRMRPTGYVTLGRILSTARTTRLVDIAESSFRTARATDDEADIAYVFNQYHLISCPVVDRNGRLAGVITIDDAMTVLDEEHEEDMLRLANVSEDSSISDGPLEAVKSRLPWLVTNLVTASLSALVIGQFEDSIASLVALAILMPIVASTGGIAGTQSLAVAVRALATRDLTRANAGRVIQREIIAGLLNGLGLALILGVAGWLIFSDIRIGIVLALAMIVNQMVAALGGVLVPLSLERIGLDPALASGTFVTTLTDVMGYFAFLGLATVMLL